MASDTAAVQRVDRPVLLLGLPALLAISLFLQHSFSLKQALLFLCGTGLGFALFHAAFGFTGGWRRFIRKRDGSHLRAQLLLLALTSLLFFPVLGSVWPGLQVSGAIAPVGTSVLVGAFLFGIGMQLGGGCGSGTLYTVGQGQVDMLLTLSFFIIGATVGSAHLHHWLALPALGEISLIMHWGWLTALAMQLSVLALLYWLVTRAERPAGSQVPGPEDFTSRLVHGPWPLLWGVLALALFNLLTLWLAGHPWSITFAFGLWGAKLWSALGADVSSWPYWSSGYPAQALNQSVLADVTSVMDFGVIIGALLAAALAGRVAPQTRLRPNRIAAAVLGGLLLGYGARLAFGCNIGAMLAGIASGSLHGWLWLVAAFMGSMVGIRARIWIGLDHAQENA